MPHLELTELVLAYCNFANNDQQHDIRVSHAFLVNNQFGMLLDISPNKFIKPLNESFHLLKYGLSIKILNY